MEAGSFGMTCLLAENPLCLDSSAIDSLPDHSLQANQSVVHTPEMPLGSTKQYAREE